MLLSRSAANKKAVPITSSSVLLDSERLCWLLFIVYFGVGVIGCWTKPNIANPMLLKAIWGQVTLSIIFVVWCWQQYSNRQSLELSWPRLVFLSFILWISITAFWAIRIDFYVFKWTQWLTGVFGFYLCLQLRMQHIPILLNGIMLSAVAVSLVVMAQVFLGYTGIPQAAVPAGTFGNKNLMGHFMVLSFPASIYLQLRPSNTLKLKLFYGISTVLILAAIYHTTARGSWVAVGFGITIMITAFMLNSSVRQQLIAGYKASRKQVTLLVLFELCLLLVLISFNSKGQFVLFSNYIITELGSIIETAGKTSGNTISPRYMIWRACLEMIKNAPVFGYGLGGFFENMLAGYKNFKSLATFRAHNDYLEMWIETGLPGLILYLSCIISVFYSAFYSAFYSMIKANYEWKLMVICVFSGVCSSLVNGIFSFPMQLVAPIMIISVYAAIIIRVAEEEGIKIIYLNKVSTLIRPLVLIIGIAIASLVIFVDIQWWKDYKNINKVFLQKKGVYDPDLLVFHPEQVSILWRAGKELNKLKRYRHSIEMMSALNKSWRWSTEYNLLNVLFNAHKGLGNYRRAMRIAETGLLHGRHGLFGFYTHLFLFYLSQSKTKPEYKEKAKEIYQKFASLGDAAFDKNINYYSILIFMNLRLGINTPEQYYQSIDQAGVHLADAEKNMTSFYIARGNREQATKHIKKLLKLRPNDRSASQLKAYMSQKPENKQP